MPFPRPYRATAYIPNPFTDRRARAVASRAYARTPLGLTRFISAQTAEGREVEVVHVADLLDDVDVDLDVPAGHKCPDCGTFPPAPLQGHARGHARGGLECQLVQDERDAKHADWTVDP